MTLAALGALRLEVHRVPSDIDLLASVALVALLVVPALAARRAAQEVRVGTLGISTRDERIEREAPLPLIGHGGMRVAYAAVAVVADGLAWLGVSANAISVGSLIVAMGAAALFANGHFGAGALVACGSAVADLLDGLVARRTGTDSVLGKVLDTALDRYVDALLFGGIAMYVRASGVLLALTLAALVGGFMVSYASAVLRELAVADRRAPMRRAERLATLLAGAALVPMVERLAPEAGDAVRFAPLVLALSVIAVVGNVSAARRLHRAGREATARTSVRRIADRPSHPEPASVERQESAPHEPAAPCTSRGAGS